MKTAVVRVFVALALSVVACSDSGLTRESQCRQLMTTYCNRAGGCQLFPATDVQACIDVGTSTCCAGNCGAHVVSTQADIDSCTAALAPATCASLDVQNGGALPTTCVGAVRSALTPVETAAFGTSEGNSELVGHLLSR